MVTNRLIFRRVKLPEKVPGRLWLHRMPGRKESLEEAWETIVKNGIKRVICLATKDEIRVKSPTYAKALANVVPWNHVWFPIPDYDIPESVESFSVTTKYVGDALMAGENILIHCGAGIGRTGMFAIGVVFGLGFSAEYSTELVKAAGSGPETDAQRKFLAAFFSGRDRDRSG